MISQETLEEIKKNVRLVDVVGQHIKLTRRGGSHVGLCPFHSEKTPSFNVNENENFYHCFGCSASGNVISWFMQFEGLSFPDAVEAIGERYGIEIKREGKRRIKKQTFDTKPLYSLNTLANKYFKSSLTKAPESVKEYLLDRGLDEAVVEYFGVGLAPGGWRNLVEVCKKRQVPESILEKSGLVRRNSKGEWYDTFRARLMFPVWLDGKRIAGFGGRTVPGFCDTSDEAPKYINSPETPIYQKSYILYGLPQALSTIRDTKEVIVVEGYMDVISLHKVGVTNAVATCGTALTEDHVRRLKSLANRVLLLFDGDRAGVTAASKAFETFINSGLDARVLFLGEKEDPDSIAQQQGEGTYRYLMEIESRPLLDCWIQHLVAKNGFENLDDLGAAARGKISAVVAAGLKKVENRVEREELIKNAAFLLRTAREDMAALVEGVEQLEVRTARLDVKPEDLNQDEKVLDDAIPPISELGPIDKELLYAVMAEREELPKMIMSEPVFIEGLHPAVLSFTQSLGDIVEDSSLDQEQKKSQIKELLKGCGSSWVQHWKRAYQLQEDKEVDPLSVVDGCIGALKRLRAQKTLAAVEEQIRICDDEEMRAELVQRKIDLLKSGVLKHKDSPVSL